jgi:uncharacterized protein with NRDE domain
MCLIFLSVKQHPKYKLIVAANRDEFYQRQTAPAHFWDDAPHILAGRDMEASGTWMGMTRSGKISMVTNYRDLKNLKEQAPSRGQLVSEYLLNGNKPDTYLNQVHQNAQAYNGFNLIVGTPDELYYYSNYKDTVENISQGLHGLSNHLLNTPWPKVERGLTDMDKVLRDKHINTSQIFEVLRNEEIAPDENLPDTGIGIDRERVLSSMFIKSPNYGTRCSTVVLVNLQNEVSYTERVYNLETFDYTTRTFQFRF